LMHFRVCLVVCFGLITADSEAGMEQTNLVDGIGEPFRAFGRNNQLAGAFVR
jgi:hypothetical protein